MKNKPLKTVLCILVVVVSAFLAMACTGTKKQSLSPEEVQQLQEAHPQFFGLDTSEGLNVLVYNGGKSGDWSVRLVSGNKDHYALSESIQVTTYSPLTIDEAKKMLIYYGLSDEKITLRPYDNPMSSGYTLSMLMEDKDYFKKMAEAFDNRYQIGDEFKCVYDPVIDKQE